MKKRRFRAAAAQTLARLGDIEHNIALSTQLVEEALRQGAELVVLPECMDTGYLCDSADHCRALAEPPTGFPLWDINQVVPRSFVIGAVMPMFVDLAVCRQTQMIPKVDMFADRLTQTCSALVEASPRAEAAE